MYDADRLHAENALLRALVHRVLQTDPFDCLSTEGAATLDNYMSPADDLRARAERIERRDKLIRDLRAAVGRAGT